MRKHDTSHVVFGDYGLSRGVPAQQQFTHIRTDVSQDNALKIMVDLITKSIGLPIVRETALRMVAGCEGRDDACEIHAIYNAVKAEFKYVRDPRQADYFVAPYRALEACQRGACGGDCDDHAMLNAALLSSLGFKTGIRAYGPGPERQYVHVYALVGYPKIKPTQIVAMDTTVGKAVPGWEPPPGVAKTLMVPDNARAARK